VGDLVGAEVRNALGYLADLVGKLQSQVDYLEKDRDELVVRAAILETQVEALEERTGTATPTWTFYSPPPAPYVGGELEAVTGLAAEALYQKQLLDALADRITELEEGADESARYNEEVDRFNAEVEADLVPRELAQRIADLEDAQWLHHVEDGSCARVPIHHKVIRDD